MKKLLAFLSIFSILNLNAQLVSDSVANGTGYTTQAFYSLKNGEVLNINNKDWDMAFSLSNLGAAGSAILINELTTELYAVPNDTSFWDSFDTTNYTSWKRLFNSDTTWINGAFNKHRGDGPNGTFDMGWGHLNPNNNFWTIGDSLYLCKLANGDYKKIWIESLKQGAWSFRYANIDGSSDTTVSITKADYTNKNFIYFSLGNNQILDREPDNTSWELMFQSHKDQLIPGMVIPLVSVFSNRNVWTAKTHNANYNEAILATEAETNFTKNIDNIGREWKNFTGGQWYIYDSISYFVYDNDSADLYRIVFTGFSGSINAKSFFNKEKIVTTAISSLENKVSFALYPNPSSSIINIILAIEKPENVKFRIVNMNGQIVEMFEKKNVSQLENIDLYISNLNQGIYFLEIIGESFKTSKQFIKN